MNQKNFTKTNPFFNKKLFEVKWKNPGSQLGSSSCDPSLAHYILGKREKANIFDFDYTLINMERCLKLVSRIVESKGKILIVSTDPSSSLIVKKVGQLSDQPFIHSKWANGLLTNWKQIIPHKQNSEFKSNRTQYGISIMTKLPDAIIIVNPHENADAIREARKLNIPVISFLNMKKKSNSKSEIKLNQIDYPIPSNGSSTHVIYFFFDLFVRIIRRSSRLAHFNQTVYQYNYTFPNKLSYFYKY
jgi:small subunit ribosomal protein S2